MPQARRAVGEPLAVAAPRVRVGGLAHQHLLLAALRGAHDQRAPHLVGDARGVGRPGRVARGVRGVEGQRRDAARRVEQEQAGGRPAPPRRGDDAGAVQGEVEVVPGSRVAEPPEASARPVHPDELVLGVASHSVGEGAAFRDRGRDEPRARVAAHLRRQDARVAGGLEAGGIDRDRLEPALRRRVDEVAVGEPHQHGALQHDAGGGRAGEVRDLDDRHVLAPLPHLGGEEEALPVREEETASRARRSGPSPARARGRAPRRRPSRGGSRRRSRRG